MSYKPYLGNIIGHKPVSSAIMAYSTQTKLR